jgi:hypothetical protein
MSDAAKLVTRIRANGANVALDAGKLQIVNARKLPAGALDYIKKHARAIADFLDHEGAVNERAAIIEFGANVPREWAEAFAKVLFDKRPDGVDDYDWTAFLSTCGKMIDACPMRQK